MNFYHAPQQTPFTGKKRLSQAKTPFTGKNAFQRQKKHPWVILAMLQTFQQ
jgi:hypothetical protein